MPESKSNTELGDQFKEMLGGLLSLEVNTVIKHNMTATRMRNAAHGLLDVVIEYGAVLVDLSEKGAGMPEPPKEASVLAFDLLEGWASALARGMAGLPEAAEPAARFPRPRLDPARDQANLLMLARIRDNATHLRRLLLDERGEPRKKDGAALRFDRDEADDMGEADLPLTDQQKITLRKIWEIGTEEIAMQTVIYLDGDVITRLQPQYHERAELRSVIGIHNDAVNTAISFWGKLVTLAETFLGALLSKKD